MEENTRALIKCCENPLINIIGHPDDGSYPINIREVAKAAKETGTLLELNDNSIMFRKNARENDREMLLVCKEEGMPIIIGSDAHAVGRVGAHSNAMELIDEVGFPKDMVLNYYPDELKKYVNKYRL